MHHVAAEEIRVQLPPLWASPLGHFMRLFRPTSTGGEEGDTPEDEP